MTPDLYPTPTRLQFLRDVAAGHVVQAENTWLCADAHQPRRVNAATYEADIAGWIKLDGQIWILTDAGRSGLDAPPPP